MKKILIIVSIALIAVSGVLVLSTKIITELPEFLAKNHQVDANFLIIEGWLPDLALEKINDETHKDVYDYIIPTGIRSSELDFCIVAMNGFLIFYPEFSSKTTVDTNHHNIEIVAHSKMGGIYNAHFNFYINDSLIADFSADEQPRKYGVIWNESLREIDSLSVQFTNDYLDDGGDRNLYVKEIIIDNDIVVPYQFNSVFDIGSLGGKDRIINNYTSHPEIIRNKLIASGIDSSKVIAVTGRKTKINRTLTGALALRDWLNASGYQVDGINIITMGIHARRTWLTYKKVLGKSYKVGIIALPDTPDFLAGNHGRFRTMAEALDLLYYRVILIPY